MQEQMITMITAAFIMAVQIMSHCHLSQQIGGNGPTGLAATA